MEKIIADNKEKNYMLSKVLDKHKFAVSKNKITYTDFFTTNELSVIIKSLKELHISNYIINGIRDNADRNLIIFYPEKMELNIVEKNYDSIFEIVRIKLPKDVQYEHREYLSGIMKLGIKREKFGDIIVTEDGGDIICLKEISNVLAQDLKELTRFKKSQISLEKIDDVTIKDNEFDEVKIIVTSLRLDNFVSEIARVSRNKAEEIIEDGKVFLNSVCEIKCSKKINLNDIITVRGKGKFIFESIERKTNNERLVAILKKYK